MFTSARNCLMQRVPLQSSVGWLRSVALVSEIFSSLTTLCPRSIDPPKSSTNALEIR
jgi:hypothetical protein